MSSPNNRRKMSSSPTSPTSPMSPKSPKSRSEYTRHVRKRRNLVDTDTVDLNTSVSVDQEKLNKLTFAQCKVFYTKKLNPFTNEQLDTNSLKAFKPACDNLILKGLEKWKQTPFVDPFDDTPIVIHENNIHYHNNRYKELYNLFFMFLLNNQVGDTYLTLQQIIEMLPVEHQLFNKTFDILAYEAYKQSVPKRQHKIYEVLVQNVKKINTQDVRGYEKYNNAEVSILYILTLMYANAFANYMNYIYNMLRIKDISTYSNYVKDIKEYIEHIKVIIQFTLDYDVMQALHRMINDNVNLIMQELNIKLQANIPQKTVLLFFNNILSSTNFLQDTLDIYTEIYNIYNYKNNPKHSPFVNLNNAPFGIIEDPLVKILNKIGVKEFDMSSLELPTRLFANDAEYNTYYDTYSKLKNEYISQMEKWKKYDDNPTLLPVTKPPRPDMNLPNGRKIDDIIVEIFPRHINDVEYERMKQEIKENKHIIDLYKPYLDKKLFEILSEADISIDKNGMAQLNLVNRDREYFLQNVLYNGTFTNERCVDNTDGIDYTNFENNYLLSRLQLMFQLKTYNKNNEVIRIDCFYAPNFYNYIVHKMLNNEPIKNPVTRKKIKLDRLNNLLDELMKIMNFIDIHIPRPYFVKPPMDTNLYIEQSFENSQSGQQFTRFRICCRFSHIVLPIFHLCVIPNDINPDETGSTKICSGVFASNILTLFDKGRLLHNYLPPYHSNGLYIKPMIHFNNFAQISFWEKPRHEQITMFKNYSNELQTFIDE